MNKLNPAVRYLHALPASPFAMDIDPCQRRWRTTRRRRSRRKRTTTWLGTGVVISIAVRAPATLTTPQRGASSLGIKKKAHMGAKGVTIITDNSRHLKDTLKDITKVKAAAQLSTFKKEDTAANKRPAATSKVLDISNREAAVDIKVVTNREVVVFKPSSSTRRESGYQGQQQGGYQQGGSELGYQSQIPQEAYRRQEGQYQQGAGYVSRPGYGTPGVQQPSTYQGQASYNPTEYGNQTKTQGGLAGAIMSFFNDKGDVKDDKLHEAAAVKPSSMGGLEGEFMDFIKEKYGHSTATAVKDDKADDDGMVAQAKQAALQYLMKNYGPQLVEKMMMGK
eukprot:jgi/Chlat1/1788/Chrsp134S02107